MKTPIIGASYEVSSTNAAADRCVNLYPEAVAYGGKEPVFLRKCPGLRPVVEIGYGPIRGEWKMGNEAFVVSGRGFYKVDSEYNVDFVGYVTDGVNPVSMADNGQQIFIACDPIAYIYDVSSGKLEQITDPDFPGAKIVGYMDGYFIFFQPKTQTIWVTQIYQGKSIDALDYASAEGFPDLISSIIIDHRELWVLGENSCEVWYDSGAADFPLARMQGAFVETGCAAPYSVSKLDNAIFWRGSDARGKGVVYRSAGYAGKRISTHAIESSISSYAVISDAVGMSFQQEGHSFYLLSFPTAGAAWCYDAATNLWHERASFNNGIFGRYKANCMLHFNGEILCGDGSNGYIYALSHDYHMDGTDTMRWLRSWRAIPPGQNSLKRTVHHSLQVDMESGVGLENGDDPICTLRWSDDGGHTWSNDHDRSMGKVGEYRRRVKWNRLGTTAKLRDRVYEISGSDPVPVTIMGAEINAAMTNA